MFFSVRLGAAILAALSLTACTTVTRGTKLKYSIISEPSGADVVLSTGESCITPCKIKLKRKHSFVAKVTKSGYEPAEMLVESRVRAGGAAALSGNIVIGGAIGILIDASNGSANDLRPNPLIVKLKPIESAPVIAAEGAAIRPSTSTDSQAPAAPSGNQLR